jgi:hypothetical protein
VSGGGLRCRGESGLWLREFGRGEAAWPSLEEETYLDLFILCSSCVSPGGTGGQKLAQLPELASAEMSLHAIYLHQVSRGLSEREMWGGSRE